MAGGQLGEHEAGLIRAEAAVAFKRALDARIVSGEALPSCEQCGTAVLAMGVASELG